MVAITFLRSLSVVQWRSEIRKRTTSFRTIGIDLDYSFVTSELELPYIENLSFDSGKLSKLELRRNQHFAPRVTPLNSQSLMMAKYSSVASTIE